MCLLRWKLHCNWVSEVRYFSGLNSFASCSCDPVNSLVVGASTHFKAASFNILFSSSLCYCYVHVHFLHTGSPSGSTSIEALLSTTSETAKQASISSVNAFTSEPVYCPKYCGGRKLCTFNLLTLYQCMSHTHPRPARAHLSLFSTTSDAYIHACYRIAGNFRGGVLIFVSFVTIRQVMKISTHKTSIVYIM